MTVSLSDQAGKRITSVARPPSAPSAFWGRAAPDISEQTGPQEHRCSPRCPADGRSIATADSRQTEFRAPGLLNRADSKLCSWTSRGHGDCCSSAVRMVRANALQGRKSLPNGCSTSTRLGSPRGSPLAGPGGMIASTIRQAQRRAARAGQPASIAAVGTRALIHLPRQSERLHSSTFPAQATLQPTAIVDRGPFTDLTPMRIA